MYIITKYNIPISDFDEIPARTRLEVIRDWNEYEGFIAVKYRSGAMYFSLGYFEEIPSLVECV